MGKKFNVTGVCRPQMHYMVRLDSRLAEIRSLVEAGEYKSGGITNGFIRQNNLQNAG